MLRLVATRGHSQLLCHSVTLSLCPVERGSGVFSGRDPGVRRKRCRAYSPTGGALGAWVNRWMAEIDHRQERTTEAHPHLARFVYFLHAP